MAFETLLISLFCKMDGSVGLNVSSKHTNAFRHSQLGQIRHFAHPSSVVFLFLSLLLRTVSLIRLRRYPDRRFAYRRKFLAFAAAVAEKAVEGSDGTCKSKSSSSLIRLRRYPDRRFAYRRKFSAFAAAVAEKAVEGSDGTCKSKSSSARMNAWRVGSCMEHLDFGAIRRLKSGCVLGVKHERTPTALPQSREPVYYFKIVAYAG